MRKTIGGYMIVGSAIGLLVFLLGGLVAALECHGYSSSEAAGWIQAIGSIGAIAAAFGVMNAQLRSAAQDRARSAAQDRIDSLEAVFQIARRAPILIDGVFLEADQISNEWGSASFVDDPRVGLAETLTMLSDIPLYAAPYARATHPILEIRQAIPGAIKAANEMLKNLRHANNDWRRIADELRSIQTGIRLAVESLEGTIMKERHSLDKKQS